MESGPYLSLIVPAYNESTRIVGPLREIADYLAAQTFDVEVLVIDDGSADNTLEVVEELAQELPCSIKPYRYEQNRGKGYALKVGFERASGRFIVFTDADLATPITELPKLLGYLEQGYDVVIGSRKMVGAEIRVHQPRYREQLGKVFTRLVRGSIADVSDVTCGFKGFTSDVGKEIFGQARVYDWGFDAEVLAIATRFQYRIQEVPVAWEDQAGTKVRVLRDGLLAGLSLLRIWGNLAMNRYQPSNRSEPIVDDASNE